MKLTVKIGKRGIVTALILLVVLVAYNILFFAIPFNRDLSNASFWITYGITTFLILFMSVVVFIGIGSKDVKSRIFGVPILYLGFSTLIAQLVIDIIVMSVGNFFEFKSWIAIVVETLLLAFFFISLIARTAYKDTIKKVDAKVYKETFVKDLRVNLEVVLGSCKDSDVSKELNKLFETVKYTDPVSDASVVDIEDQITNVVESLKLAINNGDNSNAIELIQKINSLVNERKLRLKSLR